MAQINCTQTSATSSGSSKNNSSPSEDTLHPETIVIFSFLALLAIAIIIINFCVVFLVWKKQTLRTPANICLASLACSDLLTGLNVIPLVIICTLFGLGPWCLSMEFINRMLSISAILHLLVIAVERYVVIVCLVRLDNLLSCKRYVIIVSAVWFIPLCVSLIQMSWLNWKDGVPYLHGVSRAEIIYDCVCFFGFVCLPLLIIIISYSRVFFVLRRHAKDISKQESLFASDSKSPKYKLKEKRATLIYTAMIIFFVLAWFPYFLMALSKDLGGGEMVVEIPERAELAFMFARFSSPLANPLLYTFFKQDFRRVIGAIRRKGIEVQVKFISASSPVISQKQLRIFRRRGSNTADL